MSNTDANPPVEPPQTCCGTVKSTILWVVVIAVVALGLRLGYVLTVQRPMEFPDEKQYWNIGVNFAAGNGFQVTVDPGTDEVLHYPLEIQRPPVYPLMLALTQKLRISQQGVRVLQALMGALTCLLIYLLAKELAGEWPARIAGLIAAIDPFFIYFTRLLLSETLFLLLFVASWYYVVKTWKEFAARASAPHWVSSCMVAGLLGAGAVLTRSEALVIYLLIPVAWLAVGPRRLTGFAVGLMMIGILLVGMSPWIARNYKRTWDKNEDHGQIVLTTLKVGESLYEAVGPFATGGPNKENTAWPPEVERMADDEYARNQFLLDRSIVYMKENPGRTLRLAAKKFLRTWNIFPNYSEARTGANLWISASSFIPELATALVGLAFWIRRREVAWLLLPVVLTTLTHMVFVGSVRYRLSMMPFVIVLSGIGAAWLIAKVFCRAAAPKKEAP